MTDYDRLKVSLRDRPVLHVLADEVSLITETDAFRQMNEASPLFDTPLLLNLRRCLESFRAIAGGSDRTFGLAEIAKILGLSYPHAHSVVRAGILPPSVRPLAGGRAGNGCRFSYRDAFAAGIIGAVRRQGVSSSKTLRRVASLIASLGADESQPAIAGETVTTSKTKSA